MTALKRNGSGRSRGQVAAIVATVLLAISCAGLFSAGSARANGPCTDVEIVGLRGSSEPYLGSEHGMGALLGPVADTIMTQLSGAVTFSSYGVPYPAVDAISGVLDGDYFESKEKGSEMLHEYLLERVIECPGTKFVVMGYSQGAHAAGDQLAHEASFITNKIAALVMFGDPRFNPGSSYALGTFDSRDHGLAGARSLSDFSSWGKRVFSFCHQNDVVCQGVGWGHGSDAHAQSKYVVDYADLVAGLVRNRLGLTRLPRVPLDLAFVIDSTGSMTSSIQEVREAVSSMVDKLEEKESDYRIGLVDYKDTDQGDPYAAQLDLDLSDDVTTFRAALDSFGVDGGGDYPEAVFSGLMKAFTELSWRPSSRKAVILMGDAPGKDPEPITGYTKASVLAAAHRLPAGSSAGALSATATPTAVESGDSVSIYPIAVGSGPLETFEPLAEETGGSVFFATGASTVSEEVLEAVDTAAAPVEVVLSSVSPARPGELVSFTAGASYAGGEIAEYAWDFDGDGIVDETTTGGHGSHVYPSEFEGFAEVTAITVDGHEGSASTPVTISEDAPLAAGAPLGLSVVSPTANFLRASWRPPSDLGGGDLAGYQVAIEDLGDGGLEDARGVDPLTDEVSLGPVASGAYAVTVTAITDAGPGASAEGRATVAAAALPPPPSATAAVVPATAPAAKRPRCGKGHRRRKVHGKARCVKHKKHRHRARR